MCTDYRMEAYDPRCLFYSTLHNDCDVYVKSHQRNRRSSLPSAWVLTYTFCHCPRRETEDVGRMEETGSHWVSQQGYILLNLWAKVERNAIIKVGEFLLEYRWGWKSVVDWKTGRCSLSLQRAGRLVFKKSLLDVWPWVKLYEEIWLVHTMKSVNLTAPKPTCMNLFVGYRKSYWFSALHFLTEDG